MFEQTILPHLAAAYNLARWLAGNEHDAEDIVQESCLRAVKFFDSFRGGNPRAWLLTIVRNCCYDFFKRNGMRYQDGAFDEETHATGTKACNPETVLLEKERA